MTTKRVGKDPKTKGLAGGSKLNQLSKGDKNQEKER